MEVKAAKNVANVLTVCVENQRAGDEKQREERFKKDRCVETRAEKRGEEWRRKKLYM